MLSFDTLRVAVLCSKRAPGLDTVLHHPQRGRLYDVACVVTSDDAQIDTADVPLLQHPIAAFGRSRAVRSDYDAVTAEALKQLGVDTVLLLGYLYVLTAPMLDLFPHRILNVHDSDLTLRDARGERRYVGLHSTRDAIVAGEKETRCTVHLVNEKLDGGPIVQLSTAYPVAPFAYEAVLAGATDVVRAYAYAHREWMMRDAFGPLCVRALEQMSVSDDTSPLPLRGRGQAAPRPGEGLPL